MPQKLQNITNTDFLINENRTDFEKTREILRSYPVPLTECARMMCSFLFAAFVSCLQRSFFVCNVRFLFPAFVFCLQRFFYLQFSFFICSLLFYLQRFFFVCSVSFLFAALLFCLQRFFFVCSVSFLFAAFLFCLQRFFFVCSMSLVGHRRILVSCVSVRGINVLIKIKKKKNVLKNSQPSFLKCCKYIKLVKRTAISINVFCRERFCCFDQSLCVAWTS